jgi:hypothetical protein
VCYVNRVSGLANHASRFFFFSDLTQNLTSEYINGETQI